MGVTLHTLAPNPGATRKRKRVGRGRASGNGKTAGRGQKGQKARTGHHGTKGSFEGGQMPLQRRLPKRGFNNPFRVESYPVNLGVLAERFDEGVVDVDAMRQAGLVPKRAALVKVLATGEISKPLKVRAHRFSNAAVAKLEAAGGAAERVSDRPGARAQEASGSSA